jgi:hypothetical protein
MYSEVINGLGLSQSAMEMIVFVGIFVAVIGVILVLYWKYIIMGALAVGCVAVMANHKPTEKNIVPPVVEKKEEVLNHVKPSEETPKVETPEKQTETSDARSMFMEDCINLADYTRTQCEDLWFDRVQEERAILEEAKSKGKKHGHYRKV